MPNSTSTLRDTVTLQRTVTWKRPVAVADSIQEGTVSINRTGAKNLILVIWNHQQHRSDFYQTGIISNSCEQNQWNICLHDISENSNQLQHESWKEAVSLFTLTISELGVIFRWLPLAQNYFWWHIINKHTVIIQPWRRFDSPQSDSELLLWCFSLLFSLLPALHICILHWLTVSFYTGVILCYERSLMPVSSLPCLHTN